MGRETPDDLNRLVGEVIAELEAIGLQSSARRLAGIRGTAFTTGSERPGELGAAVKEIRDECRMPAVLDAKLERIMIEVHRIWPSLQEDSLMFKRIDHVEIVTDQPERTVEFYTEVLGFKVRSRDRIDGSPLGVPMSLVYLDLGGTTVELISYGGAPVEPAPRNEHLGYRMMALEVDDMQATVEYLRTKGIGIVWGPKVREKYARAEICDPNGFHIELRQWLH